MCGYFSGLSVPSVTEITTTFAALAEIEQCRADEISDILDEYNKVPGAEDPESPAHDAR